MKIFTAHWKEYTDDYYAPHNRRMFLHREDADKFLDDLINYEGIDSRYYILEETVFDQYSPINHIVESDWECEHGTLHGYNEACHCDDYPCDIINDF